MESLWEGGWQEWGGWDRKIGSKAPKRRLREQKGRGNFGEPGSGNSVLGAVVDFVVGGVARWSCGGKGVMLGGLQRLLSLIDESVECAD